MVGAGKAKSHIFTPGDGLARQVDIKASAVPKQCVDTISNVYNHLGRSTPVTTVTEGSHGSGLCDVGVVVVTDLCNAIHCSQMCHWVGPRMLTGDDSPEK